MISRTSRRFILGCIFVLSILLVLMTYNCAEGCSRTFSAVSHFSQHKKTCRYAQAVREKTRGIRKEKGLGPTISKDITLLLDRKQRLQASFLSANPSRMRAENLSMDVDSAAGSSIGQSGLSNISNPVPPAQELDTANVDPLTQNIGSTGEPLLPKPLTRSGRPRREHRLPQRFRDNLPQPPAPATVVAYPEPPLVRRVILIVRDRLVTALNSFGIWKDYPNRPTADPDALLTLEDLSNHPISPSQPRPVTSSGIPSDPQPAYWPFLNKTTHAVMRWLNNGTTTKSESETTDFVHNVILSPNFSQDDLLGFDAHRENQRLDKAISDSAFQSQFIQSTVEIMIPSGKPNVKPEKYLVPGLLHRKIVNVISDAFNDPLAHLLHYSPFKLFQKNPNTGDDERIYGEIYTSDAFLEETEKVRRHSPEDPNNPECKRERVVAALMFSSDATHLTNFGNAKAWPIYLMLGNLSKYIRSQPNSGGMHHLAYIPSLPESFRTFVESFHPKWKSQKAQILAHCRRELMHSVWKLLLDDEFVHAYTYGIVIKCIDGIERRIFPRLFTYSADYPEKVLLATIRDNGMCPCPRCLISKSKLDKLGLKRDFAVRIKKFRSYIAHKVQIARDFIYQLAKPINGAAVEALLKDFSGVPTSNAFVERLGKNPSEMLVVDLLHEFELGVWKALFTHLIRLLYAAAGSDKYVAELDRRYFEISTFGRGTIRNFSANSSEMKKLAARDFEDLLQCAIPVFEGLLEGQHNRRLMKLLYRTAEWHALAKLRMHTDSSLILLEELTTEFGQLLRQFRDLTCTRFTTFELPRESAARKRRETQKSQTGQCAPAPQGSTTTQDNNTSTTLSGTQQARTSGVGRKTKMLNLLTVKLHFLGDYVRHIRLFGTTDSYSTQLGELAHRLVKRLYGLTNKKDAMKQIGKKYSRRQALRNIEYQEEQEVRSKARLEDHHIISESRNMPVPLFEFVQNNVNNPATKNFICRLQDHILGRMLGYNLTSEDCNPFTNNDRNTIRICNNIIYQHSTARINYTTYDMRRDYDTINPRTHPFVIVPSPETELGAHPFWYAAVLGIFHAEVQHIGRQSSDLRPRIVEFLLVRWLAPVHGYSFGRKHAKLPKISFLPDNDEFSFGFLDPSYILRGCHLIPAFVNGKKNEPLFLPDAPKERIGGFLNSCQWNQYYVGIFVDRDMTMRFLGMGIGHMDQFTQNISPVPSDGDFMDCDPCNEDEEDENGDEEDDNGDDCDGCEDKNEEEDDKEEDDKEDLEDSEEEDGEEEDSEEEETGPEEEDEDEEDTGYDDL